MCTATAGWISSVRQGNGAPNASARDGASTQKRYARMMEHPARTRPRFFNRTNTRSITPVHPRRKQAANQFVANRYRIYPLRVSLI